jgi:DNA-binding LacI/PurR family transcriptional regulator
MMEEAMVIEESSQCMVPLESPSQNHDAWLSDACLFIKAWLDRPTGKPTAMICSNDELAMALIDQMRKRRLEPGRDLSVIGYDNIESRSEGEGIKPFLTTIDNPREAVGRRCGEVLLNQLLYGQPDHS